MFSWPTACLCIISLYTRKLTKYIEVIGYGIYIWRLLSLNMWIKDVRVPVNWPSPGRWIRRKQSETQLNFGCVKMNYLIQSPPKVLEPQGKFLCFCYTLIQLSLSQEYLRTYHLLYQAIQFLGEQNWQMFIVPQILLLDWSVKQWIVLNVCSLVFACKCCICVRKDKATWRTESILKLWKKVKSTKKKKGSQWQKHCESCEEKLQNISQCHHRAISRVEASKSTIVE